MLQIPGPIGGRDHGVVGTGHLLSVTTLNGSKANYQDESKVPLSPGPWVSSDTLTKVVVQLYQGTRRSCGNLGSVSCLQRNGPEELTKATESNFQTQLL